MLRELQRTRKKSDKNAKNLFVFVEVEYGYGYVTHVDDSVVVHVSVGVPVA